MKQKNAALSATAMDAARPVGNAALPSTAAALIVRVMDVI